MGSLLRMRWAYEPLRRRQELTSFAAGGTREHPRSDGGISLRCTGGWNARSRPTDVLLGILVCTRSVELRQDEGGASND